ncbi:hypothetical protein [Alienimonas sp. DA493]|uniref:hypothetical protein n=1 Tax=Alienimonas sp. DA493 TaxID=3373605 RepID=UPI0037548940
MSPRQRFIVNAWGDLDDPLRLALEGYRVVRTGEDPDGTVDRGCGFFLGRNNVGGFVGRLPSGTVRIDVHPARNTAGEAPE